jgi:hypothetical protein
MCARIYVEIGFAAHGNYGRRSEARQRYPILARNSEFFWGRIYALEQNGSLFQSKDEPEGSEG